MNHICQNDNWKVKSSEQVNGHFNILLFLNNFVYYIILYIRNEVNLYQIIANAEAAETGPENVMFFTMFRSRDIHALHN